MSNDNAPQTITKPEKLRLVADFVFHTVADRIRAVRDEAIDHYLDVVNELYTPNAVTEINRAMRALVNNLEVARAALNSSGRGYGDTDPIGNNLVRTAEMKVIVTKDSDPFNIAYLHVRNVPTEISSSIRENVDELWKETSIAPVELEVPLLRLVKGKEEEDEDADTCSLDDSVPTYDINLIGRLSVTDCTTAKRFKANMDSIGADASRLAATLWETISACRTTQAIVNKVPQLGDFIEERSHRTNDLTNLISQVAGK